MKRIDLTAQIFGRLTVTSRNTDERKSQNAHWNCLCECGAYTVARGSHLRLGRIKSCGCLSAEMAAIRHTTHGMSGCSEQSIWFGMKSRCYNKNYYLYHRYGGRGITVCDSWLNDFHRFISNMGERPSKEHSIDRIDNDKGYSPDNCRWATREEQNSNTSRNIKVELFGKTQTVSQWADVFSINRVAIYKLITRKNMSPRTAIFEVLSRPRS